MKNVTPLKKALKVPAKFNAEEYFSNYFGVIVDDRKPEIIDLKVVADQVDYFETLPLHRSQKLVESAPEYSIFRYCLVPTFDFKQEILSHGSAVEVISP